MRDADEPPATGHAAPSLDEIAAAFPQLEVIGLIGQGGMGFVYQVRQPGLDRTVALKILSPELGRDPAFAERFARESRALGKLNHPNIVTVFEHGVSQPSTLNSHPFFYLLMEYVDGVNLRQAMRAGRFTPEQALAIVPGICDALQAAHAQGIWHRDIKPENILLDREGRVKIADFGIARMVGDPQRNFTLTMTGGALGSAAYMAPEQHENPRDVDHRADIYSLGVVIYEMLTGELPLGRFPAPSQRAAVDARIDEIVFKTLEKERELRQQSAAEVKTDVQGVSGVSSAQPTRRTDVIPTTKSGLGKLAISLFLGGILIPLLLVGLLPQSENSLFAFGVVALVFALVIGLIARKERLGRIAWIGSCLVLVSVLPMLMVMRLANVQSALAQRERVQRETAPRYNNSVKVAFAHQDILHGGCSFTLPMDESKSWFPRNGQTFSLKDARQVFVRSRLTDVNSESVLVLIDCSSDGTNWETKGIRVGTTTQGELIDFSNGTRARITIVGSSDRSAGSDSAPNWKATLPDSDSAKRKVVELSGRPETKLLSGMQASGWMVHVGTTPVLLIAGEGTTPGYSGEVGGGKVNSKLKIGSSVLRVFMEGGDSVSVNGTVFDLKKSRVLLLDRDGRVKQIDSPLDHILDEDEMDKFLGRLILEDGFYYKTPEFAVASHIKAAKQDAQGVFEVGVSTRLIDEIGKGGVDVTEAMRKWSELSFLKVVRETSKKATVRLVDERTKVEAYAELVWWNDSWQIDSLVPVMIASESENGPELAMKTILKAAEERNARVFQNGFSKSLKATIQGEVERLDQFGDFAQTTFLSSKTLDASNAEVVVEANDGSRRRFTFRMILEGGEWKLNELESKP